MPSSSSTSPRSRCRRCWSRASAAPSRRLRRATTTPRGAACGWCPPGRRRAALRGVCRLEVRRIGTTVELTAATVVLATQAGLRRRRRLLIGSGSRQLPGRHHARPARSAPAPATRPASSRGSPSSRAGFVCVSASPPRFELAVAAAVVAGVGDAISVVAEEERPAALDARALARGRIAPPSRRCSRPPPSSRWPVPARWSRCSARTSRTSPPAASASPPPPSPRPPAWRPPPPRARRPSSRRRPRRRVSARRPLSRPGGVDGAGLCRRR